MGKRKKIIAVLGLLLVILGGWFYHQHQQAVQQATSPNWLSR